MKAIRLLLVSFFVLCVSTTNVVASNESDAAKIQRAMKAAPNSISAGAEIRDVDADWTILREAAPGNGVDIGSFDTGGGSITMQITGVISYSKK